MRSTVTVGGGRSPLALTSFATSTEQRRLGRSKIRRLPTTFRHGRMFVLTCRGTGRYRSAPRAVSTLSGGKGRPRRAACQGTGYHEAELAAALDREQPVQPAFNGDGTGGCSRRVTFYGTPTDTYPQPRAQPRRTPAGARPPQSPSPPVLRNGGSGDLRLSSVAIQPPHRFAQFNTPRATQPPLPLQRPPASRRRTRIPKPASRHVGGVPASRRRTRIPKPASRHVQRAPASRRRTRLHNTDVRGAASAPGSPLPPACHAGCFRSCHILRPSASRPRTPAAKPTPVEPRAPPDRFVRARLRCSSRASLPLTPQAGTPTATIGMRPATALRTKTKLEKTTPSGCRESWVILRVQRCPRPYRPEEALSIKKCERASSGR